MADNYLITGYWGEPHITAENDRGINAAIFGKGRFVLPVGEEFRAEYIGNNTIRMYDGKLIDNGAAAGIPAGEFVDLLIANAGQGMKRNDLIVFQYKQDGSTLIESGKFIVIQGTETSGTAKDPTLTKQDLLTNEATLDQFALYRVAVSGTAISAPVKVFEVFEFDSRKVYQLTWNTSTNAITNGDAIAASLFEDITGGKDVEILVDNGTYNYKAVLTDRNKGIFAVISPRFQRIYSWTCNGASIKFLNEQYIASECVVASGTQGNWNFRQWTSGVAECWGTVKFALSKDAYEWASGTGIYCASGYGNGSDGSDTIPNIFTSYDCVSIDPIQWYQIGASGRVTAGGTLEANVFGKGDNMTALKKGDTVSVNCIVKGKWK